MSLIRVPIFLDDSLEQIAARVLGDAGKWPEIARLNNLRYPFISSDPADHYGPLVGMTTLAAFRPPPSALPP